MPLLRSLITVVGACLYILVAGAIFVPYAMITRNDALMFQVGITGVRFAAWLAGVQARLERLERIRPEATYVYMCNHVSNVDVLVIAYLPRAAGLAKYGLFKIPFLGQALRISGFIPVVRGTSRAAAAVDAGVAALRGGRSLLVFPEGTRSTTGELIAFRHGVFLMAIRAQVPIVPVTLVGAREIMRKGDPRIYPGEVRIILHDPIPTAGLVDDDRQALAERVRAVIASALPPPAEASASQDAIKAV